MHIYMHIYVYICVYTCVYAAADVPTTPHVRISDSALRLHLSDPLHPLHAHAVNFFLHLAVNHSVICEHTEDGLIT